MTRTHLAAMIVGAASLITGCNSTGLDVIVRDGDLLGATTPNNQTVTGSGVSQDASGFPQNNGQDGGQLSDPGQDAVIDWEAWLRNQEGSVGDAETTADGGGQTCSGGVSLSEASYRIRARDKGCLRDGEAFTLSGSGSTRLTATELVVGDDCVDSASVRFRLIPSVGGWFEFLNERTQQNMDVFLGDFSVGNKIVLYQPHGMSVQWFRFLPGRENFMMIATERDPNLCLTRVGSTVELSWCTDAEPTQEWQLLGFSCPG